MEQRKGTKSAEVLFVLQGVVSILGRIFLQRLFLTGFPRLPIATANTLKALDVHVRRIVDRHADAKIRFVAVPVVTYS